MSYCYGSDYHIKVKELDSKVYHDEDKYFVSCSRCGACEQQFARRPGETLLMCLKVEDD